MNHVLLDPAWFRGTPLGGDVEGDAATEPPGAAAAPQAEPRPALRWRGIIADAPVVGFTGPNGAGKTLVAVSEAIADLATGRTVVSTVPIASLWGSSLPLLSLRQLLDLEHTTVLIDEVSVVLSSRATGGLPPEVETFLQSMRHQDVTLRWTAPSWARADVILREVTQVAVNVHPLLRYTRPGAFWPTPRLVMAGAMDTTSVATDAVPERVMRRRVWRPRAMPGWGAYDSEHRVSRIGWPRQQAVCADCGGKTKVVYCSPERHADLGIRDGIRTPAARIPSSNGAAG